ncbi:MAG: DUF5317 domain-containing protein [Anaerolineae bacterium]
MFLYATVLIALLIATLRGGSIKRLAHLPLRWGWLAMILFAAQAYLIFWPEAKAQGHLSPRAMILVFSYLILIFVAWSNRSLPGVNFILLGIVLNFLVIVANGGFMPVTPQTLIRGGHTHLVAALESGARVARSKDVLLWPEQTRLWFLSDIFVIPERYPLAGSFSLGDVLIASGAFILLQRALLIAPEARR